MARRRRQRFEYHPEAILETRAAVAWYAQRSEFAPANFKTELRQAEKQVKQYPDRWSTYLHGTRYFQLDRFPYALVYIERGERIIGIAVAHLKRRPGSWRKRLADY
jgi:hypothetical protein